MVSGHNTGKNVTKTVIGIVILALAITVFIQHRRIIALISEANQISPQEEVKKYKAQIKTLESRIADLKSKQGHSLTILNRGDTASKVEIQETPVENRVEEINSLNNRPDFMNNTNMRNNLRRSISGRYEAFATDINLSEVTKSKLYDLLAEMRIEIMNRFPRPGRGGFSPEMMDSEDFRQQIEEVNTTYNKKLSEVLSADELNAFREYQNSESERMLLTGFNVMAEDNSLDKEKTNELIAAMYSARQNDPETRREDNALMIQAGPPFGRGPMNEGAENDGKLNSVYLESAKNILSEDQMKEFEGYLNSRQTMFNMRRMPQPDRPQGDE
jgi:hypothetical protein